MAYRSGSKLHEKRTGLIYDYSRKAGVVHSEIMLPTDAPDWMQDREKLWNGVDAAEKRCDAQTGREVRVALPQELTTQQQLDVLRSFSDGAFVSRGMVVDFSLHHDNPQNPHAHIVMTTRGIDGDGFGLKCRDWNNKDLFLEWRESWADACNRSLSRAGHDMRIDHRSYAEQGVALQPSVHVGKDADRAKADVDGFVVQERLQEQDRIARENGATIIAFPEIALHALSMQRATFSREDVGQWLFSRTGDAEQFAKALGAVMSHEDVVRLESRDQNRDACFTTKQAQEAELVMKAQAGELLKQEQHQVPKQDLDQACAQQCLNAEQREVVELAIDGPGLTVVACDKGGDRARMLDAARSAWSGQGYHVTAVAASGAVARSFQQDTGIVTSVWRDLESAWAQEENKLTHRNVLIVEDAGLMGPGEMACVLGEAANAHAKVVLLDEVHPSTAGSQTPLRAIEEIAHPIRPDEVHRQREEWQREASASLVHSDAENALNAYAAHGHVHACGDREAALQATAHACDQGRNLAPDSVMVARAGDDVDRLNALAREIAASRGQLGHGEDVQTCSGVRAFCEGDRVRFGVSDRQMGVREDSLGTLIRLQNGQMLVALDGDGRHVAFDTRSYNAVEHGYAVPVDKMGGLTAERVYVYSSPEFDSGAARIALTRHTTSVDIFADKEGLAAMVRQPRLVECENEALKRDGGLEPGGRSFEPARLSKAVSRLQGEERDQQANEGTQEQKGKDLQDFDLGF